MKIAALDIGGTSIKSGICTGGATEEVKEWDTDAAAGGAAVIDRAKEILHGYEGFEAIGISTAGQVNSEEGSIRYANENIPGYTGMKIKAILEAEFAVPVAVENDVNAAAIGEGHFGAGKAYDDFLCITYGTGVGGAIVIHKKVYTGTAFSAGEFGGILIHPEALIAGDPFSGCYEKYASATALVARAKKLDSGLTSGRKIFERLEEDAVKRVVDQWIDEIVYGLISIIHIFNPACVVLGGGVMAQPYIIEEVRKKTAVRVMSSFRDVVLKPAALGNQAGLLGAAYLAKKYAETRT
ncbi:MAG: ROK family protein [Hungatella sp.]